MKRNQLMPRTLFRSFTLIELLVVIAILAILASFVLGSMFSATNKAKAAVARNQISSMATALEAYNTDMGYYPRHPQSSSSRNQFADIPHLLYAALANRATPTLGGGINSPYMKLDNNTVGVMLKAGDYLDDNTGIQALKDLKGNDESPLPNCRMLTNAENPAATAFQKPYPGGGQCAEVYSAAYADYRVFIDPFLNAYHYREWQTKSDAYKDSQANAPAANRRPHNFSGFDIWSNGPDGINQFGHPDSDDVTNWGK